MIGTSAFFASKAHPDLREEVESDLPVRLLAVTTGDAITFGALTRIHLPTNLEQAGAGLRAIPLPLACVLLEMAPW